MADEITGADTLKEAASGSEKGARFWLSEIKSAGKVEKKWRQRADKLVDRYRDEGRDEDRGTKLNIFWANVQLLKPAVFSATPAPDVRRRNISEDDARAAVGREVSLMLEKGLSYAIDAWSFDPPMYAVRDDMLIVGRGVSREIYEADIVRREDVIPVLAPPPVDELTGLPLGEPTVTGYTLDGAPVEPEFEGEDKRPVVEQKVDERIYTKYVFWADFRMAPARCWEDVWWIAFRHVMTREELEDQFPDADVSKVPLNIASGDHPGDAKASDAPKDPEHAFGRAEVWEVWSKRDKQRIWVAMGHDSVIRRDDDPLKLAGFFPMPRPIYAVSTTDTMVPVPEFCLYQDQANELDEVQARIRSLTTVLKDVKVISGDFVEAAQLADAKDGDLIPISRPGAEAEDLRSAVWENPIATTIQVILGLVQRSEQLRQFIYEVTGISDLMRGATAERETAKAQGLKGQYGQVRMTPRSQPMHEFARDSLRIKAEIFAEMFDQATLQRISGAPVTPEMMTMLRDEKLRNTNVEVATDSTIRPDKQAEKQEAIEYVSAVMGFLEKAAGIAQSAPPMIPLLMEILKAATRPFKFGRGLEEQIDQTADQMSAMAMQMVHVQIMSTGQPQPGAPGATPPGAGPPPNGAMQ